MQKNIYKYFSIIMYTYNARCNLAITNYDICQYYGITCRFDTSMNSYTVQNKKQLAFASCFGNFTWNYFFTN